ncbi:MAG: GtrA family protein [Pseudomonadales bacterium]|nr:GtrA family protein [Pseudomonadales bacterium]
MKQQLSWFVLVGMAASLTHYLVVLGLVGCADWHPLRANVMAFLIAFGVSYTGHRHLTFKAQAISHRQTLPRFFAVALASFLLNQGLFAYLLLARPQLPYFVSLGIVLVVVAVVTFVSSRLWAFRQGGHA